MLGDSLVNLSNLTYLDLNLWSNFIEDNGINGIITNLYPKLIHLTLNIENNNIRNQGGV